MNDYIKKINKFKLLIHNNRDEYEKNIQKCNELKSEIKKTIFQLDSNAKKEMQEKLKSAGLPVNYTKLTDASVLSQILETVSA